MVRRPILAINSFIIPRAEPEPRATLNDIAGRRTMPKSPRSFNCGEGTEHRARIRPSLFTGLLLAACVTGHQALPMVGLQE